MRAGIKKVSIRFLVLFVVSVLLITGILPRLAPRFRSVSTASVLKASDALKEQQVAVPDAWRKLDILDRVTLRLPEDMKPSELIGDSFAYREAYRNHNIDITISYGSAHPARPNLRSEPIDPCVTPQNLLQESTYHESVLDIAGKKAKLSINRHYQPEFIMAKLCFLNPEDKSHQLILWAQCKDDLALNTARQIFNSIIFKDHLGKAQTR